LKNDNGYGKMTGYGRGGIHSNAGWKDACLATCYKGVLSVKQKKTWFEKEYHHLKSSEGYSSRLNEKQFDEINISNDGKNMWIGQKFIVYDIDNGNQAKCELWVDRNSSQSIDDPTKQDWILVNTLIDKGDQPGPKKDGDDMKRECNCDKDNPVFAWGGPTVTWRIDQCKVQFAKVSVREFIP